jgi:acetyltransferase-like isoleucine patch superfamily enzyme
MRDIIAGIRGRLFILMCRFFRKNINIKEGLRIYKRLSIGGNGRINIGKNCIVDGIRGDSSQYVTIDAYNPEAVITIGDDVHFYAARIAAKFQITIGDGVLIEESGITDSDFHSIDRSRGNPPNENRERCQINIGNRVCIGARSLITKGVTIGADAVIAPGSIVTAFVKQGSIVLGNPSRPMMQSQSVEKG